MQRLEAETHKFAQTRLKQHLSDEPSVNMIEIARHVSRTSAHRTELESLLATRAEKKQKTPWEALAVPTGKPLSVFDPSALPAAFTQFLYGDCIPFHKRLTPVSTQETFNVLRDRQELTYSLDKAYEVKTSFETPGFERDLNINSTKAHDQASPYERKHALDSGETHPVAEMFATIIGKQNLLGTVKLSTLSKAGC